MGIVKIVFGSVLGVFSKGQVLVFSQKNDTIGGRYRSVKGCRRSLYSKNLERGVSGFVYSTAYFE